MTTETMTIHRGLAEIKVLENRILKAISEAKFCAAAKQSMKKLNGVPIEDYKKDAQSSLDSINDLIARHDAIKRAISESNAKTTVTINGVVYTVAEAIYMNQHGIDFKQRLLNMLDYQYSSSIANIETANARLSDRADDYTKGLASASEKSNMDPEAIQDARDSYIERETMILIDGIDIKKIRDEITSKISKFKAEVDAVLSASNATTEITIEY